MEPRCAILAPRRPVRARFGTRSNSRRELLSHHPGIEVLAECRNGFEAVKAVGERKPDLLFLDIQMPKLDGFEVLELLEPGIAVIFVTAYDEYALKAFEVHAVDYLLKPFPAERFEQALDRARGRLGRPGVPPAAMAAAARPEGTHLARLVVRDGANVHLIPVEKLDYVEAQDDYVALHTAGKCVLKQQTIGSLEASLDPARFVRVHRSYLVNLERVARIEAYTKDSKIVVLRDGAQIPVSRSGLDRLKALLDGKTP